MCGRYVAPDTAAIERQWQILRSEGGPFALRYNVAPTLEVPVLRRKDGGLVLAAARWAFVPFWWKQPTPPRISHIARLEEAATRPMWRDAMRSGRCLVPAVGWYEWRETDRQPHYFHRADGRLSAIAGLVSRYQGTLTCAILTRAAEGSLASVHDRMPVALREDAQEAWLAEGAAEVDVAAIEHHPVRRLVNNSRAEGPELIELESPPLFGRSP